MLPLRIPLQFPLKQPEADASGCFCARCPTRTPYFAKSGRRTLAGASAIAIEAAALRGIRGAPGHLCGGWQDIQKYSRITVYLVLLCNGCRIIVLDHKATNYTNSIACIQGDRSVYSHLLHSFCWRFSNRNFKICRFYISLHPIYTNRINQIWLNANRL